MLHKTLTALLVAAMLTSGAMAQEDTAASLMTEYFNSLPKKAPVPGKPAVFGNQVDWSKVVDSMGSLVVRGKDMPVEPLALFSMGVAQFQMDDIGAAEATFKDLKNRFASLPILNRKNKEGVSLIDGYLRECAKELAFRRDNKLEFLPKPELDPESDTTLHLSEGQVVIRFYKNVAPKHRANFAKLAKRGFYDRTRVHRIVANTVLQMGDPNSKTRNMDSWGKGDPGYVQAPEFSLVSHLKGTVTMYRGSGNATSHGSQFQVLLRDQPNLDFNQTAFAQVVSGLDVLERIAAKSTNQYQAPAQEVFLNGISLGNSMR